MKLLSAEFQNFRLLRDLKLEFASSVDKKLTVIRAANESGKTTVLHALQWALYGDAALPGRGEDFRLHPIDWNTSDGKRVPVTATVEFELTKHRRVANALRETRRRYRIVRSGFEYIDTESRRSASTVKLFELNDIGTSPIDPPEALINEELPPELREVFFTDGDRALSFIEADVTISTKRDRVQGAIRSLLGLGVLDNAIKHVKKSTSEANKKAKKISSSGELNEIASRLETIEEEENRLEDELQDAKQQFTTFEEKMNDTDRAISTALRKGDEEELRKDIEYTRREITRLDSQLSSANKEHSELFRSRSIATDLLAPLLDKSFRILDQLRDQGKIPNSTIPVLQDRLSVETCICGESLGPGNPESKKRREHIQKLIEDSRRADEIQEIITRVYFEAKPLQDAMINKSEWLEAYKKVVERRDGIQTLRDEAGRKIRALELQVDELPNTDIKGLREMLRYYKEQRDRALSNRSASETQISGLNRERKDQERKRDTLLREQKKGARVLAELEVIQDVMQVLQNAYKRITNEELAKVSTLMNDIFLEMIGADPEQGAIIRRALISHDFDIIVHGPNDRTLNPDRDLNGASRRALTLAFILALTKVSEVEAPNVIDTPLGMTSGYVKRSILRTSVRESAQLVLFLTHDEIAGCEEIIDEAAGTIITLTNPAHYPKMLVNDPGVIERKILSCKCDHRSECQLCQRRDDATIELTMEL